MKEKMGDRMNIVIENLVCLPKEDREKVLSQYISMMPENIDEKDQKMAEMAVMWVVDKKLAEEKAAERERIVMEAQRRHYADPSQVMDFGKHVGETYGRYLSGIRIIVGGP